MGKIEETADEKYRESIRVKQGIYTICFVLLCLIDQIMGSAMGRVQFVASNCTGFVIAVIIFTGYCWKDFMRLPYTIWTALSFLGGGYAIRWGLENYDYPGKWVTAVLNVIIYGYIVLRIFIYVFGEKKIPRINWRYCILWVVMMLCMVFSRNESIWPLWFLVMFGCFYLTEYTEEELNALFNGMLNGIIIGFFILQGFATMFRVFDDGFGYTGMYTNKNLNGLFYLLVHAAILGKWYQFKCKGAVLGWSMLAGIGSGILCAYCFLTLCRTAMIAMLLNTVLLIVLFFLQEGKRRFLKAVGRLTAVLLVAVVSFPIVFYSVRNIPAQFYSAMLLAGDPDYKIQGWTSVEDERFIEMDEFLKEAFGREFWFLQLDEEEDESKIDIQDIIGKILSPSMKVYAAEETSEEVPNKRRSWGSGLTQDDPVLTQIEDIVDPAKGRLGIFRAYFSRLNFQGHKNSEDGIWITKDSFAPHAQNFFIQMMFSYGIIAGILFLAVIFVAFMYCLMKCYREPRESWILAIGILMIFSYVSFGTLEIDWKVGQLSFTVLFIVQYMLLHSLNRRNKEELTIYTCMP